MSDSQLPIEQDEAEETEKAKIFKSEEQARYVDIVSKIKAMDEGISRSLSKIATVVDEVLGHLRISEGYSEAESEREWIVCHTCGGRKKVQRTGVTYTEKCPTCNGSGRIELT